MVGSEYLCVKSNFKDNTEEEELNQKYFRHHRGMEGKGKRRNVRIQRLKKKNRKKKPFRLSIPASVV